MSGQQHAPAVIYPRERPGTHCIGGWVGRRAPVWTAENLAPPEFDPRTVQPVAQSQYRLSYPAHTCTSIPTHDSSFTDKLNTRSHITWVTDVFVSKHDNKNKGFGTFIIAVLYLCSLSRNTIITFRTYKLKDRQINNDVSEQGVFKPKQASFKYLTSNIKYFIDTVWTTRMMCHCRNWIVVMNKEF